MNLGTGERLIFRGEKSDLEAQLETVQLRKDLESFFQRRPNRLRRIVLYSIIPFLVACSFVRLYDENKKRAGFLPCRLVAKEPVSSSGSIFYLEMNHRDSNHWLEDALLFGIYYYLDYVYKAEETDKLRKAWRAGAVWNVEFRQPQLQILRQYTPLPPSAVDSKERRGCLKFFIRNEPKGEMSSYLHTLVENAEVGVRGPNYDFRSGPDVRQIVYFAGGTGIAPALQIAHALLGDTKTNRTVNPAQLATRKLHILWASRTRSDCQGGISDPSPPSPKPRQYVSQSGLKARLRQAISKIWTEKAQPQQPLDSPLVPPPAVGGKADLPREKSFLVRELEALKEKYPGQVTVEYFVDEENTWIDQDTVSKALSRLKTGEAPAGEQPVSFGRSEVLVSGPSGFISNLAGPTELHYGVEMQGPLGGLILRALLKVPQDVKVWKL